MDSPSKNALPDENFLLWENEMVHDMVWVN